MNTRNYLLVVVTLASLFPACISSRQVDSDANRARPLSSNELFGAIENESESYPWLSSKHDKGIYSSSAETSPFRENTLTYSNLKPRIEKTSKKSRK